MAENEVVAASIIAKVFAQVLACVSCPEATAPLQFGHQIVDHVQQVPRAFGRVSDHKSAALARLDEDLFHIIGHFLRTAGDHILVGKAVLAQFVIELGAGYRFVGIEMAGHVHEANG